MRRELAELRGASVSPTSHATRLIDATTRSTATGRAARLDEIGERPQRDREQDPAESDHQDVGRAPDRQRRGGQPEDDRTRAVNRSRGSGCRVS